MAESESHYDFPEDAGHDEPMISVSSRVARPRPLTVVCLRRKTKETRANPVSMPAIDARNRSL